MGSHHEGVRGPKGAWSYADQSDDAENGVPANKGLMHGAMRECIKHALPLPGFRSTCEIASGWENISCHKSSVTDVQLQQ